MGDKISVLSRLNEDLKRTIESRSTDIAIRNAESIIRENSEVQNLARQNDIIEKKLKGKLKEKEKSHEKRMKELEKDFYIRKKQLDQTYNDRLIQLSLEVERLESERNNTQNDVKHNRNLVVISKSSKDKNKIPLDEFVSRHLLETFSNPEFAKDQLKKEKMNIRSDPKDQKNKNKEPDRSNSRKESNVLKKDVLLGGENTKNTRKVFETSEDSYRLIEVMQDKPKKYKDNRSHNKEDQQKKKTVSSSFLLPIHKPVKQSDHFAKRLLEFEKKINER